jgi:hypothetical protein
MPSIKPRPENLVPLVRFIRGEKVMLDADLALLYGVETGALNRAVKRNIARFPADFMFRVTGKEWENLKCQIGISSSPGFTPDLGPMRSQFVTASSHGGRRGFPYAFTVARGLRRAALRARETARRYGMPIYIWKDGKVVAIKP